MTNIIIITLITIQSTAIITAVALYIKTTREKKEKTPIKKKNKPTLEEIHEILKDILRILEGQYEYIFVYTCTTCNRTVKTSEEISLKCETCNNKMIKSNFVKKE